jgi:small nuclear ribonucleoprotein (snRNP)-like protein
MNITAPLYWFKEFDQYKVATTTNSESTMHKIMSYPFTVDMFSTDHIRGHIQSVTQTPNLINEDEEEWMDWDENTLYQISNQGRVKRKQYTTTHNRTWIERTLTNTLTNDGYLKVGVKLNEERKDRRVHQLVAQTWIPNPNNFIEINHKNGNKLDNRVENLEWVSRSENMKHAIDNNLIILPRYKGKLSKEQREEIIYKYNTTTISKRQLAKDYDVSHTTINSIFQNKYNYGEGYKTEYEEFLELIDKLNELREEWLLTKDKEVWYTLIQLLPSSWNQMRHWTANFQVLRKIYIDRRFHKLQEWRDFCAEIEKLPYGKELITFGVNKNDTTTS